MDYDYRLNTNYYDYSLGDRVIWLPDMLWWGTVKFVSEDQVQINWDDGLHSTYYITDRRIQTVESLSMMDFEERIKERLEK